MRFAQVVAFLTDRAREGFYGDVTIKFRDGKITLVTKIETFAESVPVSRPSLVEQMEGAIAPGGETKP